MPLGGGRAIITLRVADRDRERRRDCQRSWEVTCSHFIPVLSLCRWPNVGHGRLLGWRARLAYFSQWSGQTYPDRICRSSKCDMTIVRMWYDDRPDVIFASVVCFSLRKLIGEARHVYSWGNPDEGNPDKKTCHVSSGNVCHVASGRGVPIVPSSPSRRGDLFQGQCLSRFSR